MNSFSRLLGITILLAAVALAAPAVADENHDKWIDVLSIDWGTHKPGASTSMDDGRYKDRQGRFIIVAGGKVAKRGLDFKKYEDAATTPVRTRPQGSRDVKAPGDDQQAGLLLPAVQKVRSAASRPSSADPETGTDVQTQPQKGIEPDEIDARTSVHKPGSSATGQSRRRAGAVVEDISAKPTRAGKQKMSLQQMMAKLKPGQGGPVLRKRPGRTTSSSSPTTSGTTSVQAPAAPPSEYEIADCGTAVNPMICCHHEAGDGSSCNLFKILCGNAGGTAQGDGESAACSDWP